MSLSHIFAIASDPNPPPGIVHPLLEEKYSWVDKKLMKMYYAENNKILCLTPITWIDYRKRPHGELLEEIKYSRKRAEEDISDYECEIEHITTKVSGKEEKKDKLVFINVEYNFLY